jgi:sulfur carrier protein ThiS
MIFAQIDMRLYLGGYLDFYNPQPGKWLEVELHQPTQLSEVLAELGIPIGDAQLFVLNGELADLSEALVSDQDEVKLFPAVGGG